MVGLVTPYYNNVGFEENELDLPWTIYSRSDALEWACMKLRIADCLQKASQHYAMHMNEPEKYVTITSFYSLAYMNEIFDA